MIVPKKKVTLEQLAAVKLKTPANAGAYWRGIQHADLIESVKRAAEAHGWQCRFCAAAMSNDKADLIASFVVGAVGEVIPKGFEAMIAIKNSNAKRWGLSMFVGIRHELSETVLTLGRVPMSPIGSKRVDFNLTATMDAAFVAARDLFSRALSTATTLMGDMSEQACESFLLQMGSHGLMPWKRVGAARERLAKYEPSAWALISALSEQIDKAPLCARRDQLELRFELCQLLKAKLTGESPKILAVEVA